MTKKLPNIVDYYVFELWDMDDNSCDIHCRREGFPIDEHLMLNRARYMTSSLAEEFFEEEELVEVRLFKNGTSSTVWRKEEVRQDLLGTQWYIRCISSTLFEGCIDLPVPPKWILNLSAFLLWSSSRLKLFFRREKAFLKKKEIHTPESLRDQEKLENETEYLDKDNIIPFPRK